MLRTGRPPRKGTLAVGGRTSRFGFGFWVNIFPRAGFVAAPGAAAATHGGPGARQRRHGRSIHGSDRNHGRRRPRPRSTSARGPLAQNDRSGRRSRPTRRPRPRSHAVPCQRSRRPSAGRSGRRGDPEDGGSPDPYHKIPQPRPRCRPSSPCPPFLRPVLECVMQETTARLRNRVIGVPHPGAVQDPGGVRDAPIIRSDPVAERRRRRRPRPASRRKFPEGGLTEGHADGARAHGPRRDGVKRLDVDATIQHERAVNHTELTGARAGTGHVVGARLDVRGQGPRGPVWKSNTARSLNHRVDLHAIDATPARWRGTAPLDRARTAASSSEK